MDDKADMQDDPEIARRRRAASQGATDRERWTDPAAYEAFWSERAEAAARMVEPGWWVCDIGCGAHLSLGRFLPAGAVYLPADLRAWTPRVAVCDLNAGHLPRRALRSCDVTCLLGVLEYINDVPALLGALARRSPHLILSYNCPELGDVDRLGYGWVNAFSETQIRLMLAQAGYEVLDGRRVGAMEVVLKARYRRAGAWGRLARRLARYAFTARLS